MKDLSSLPGRRNESLPDGVVLEDIPFVPRLVMTPELEQVAKVVLSHWRMRGRFEGLKKFGIRPLDRLLLYGPPGNGKTLTALWLARELKAPLYRVLCDQLHGPYLSQTSRNVAGVIDYFDRREAPTILLFDEAESIFINRADAAGSCGREIGSATAILLQGLDRWRAPVLLLFATNLPGALDPALLSRLELRIEFGPPNAKQCEQLLEYWRELLCEYGADDWGPKLQDGLSQQRPASFREMQQAVARAARDWVAAGG